jgi:hypothetical protein
VEITLNVKDLRALAHLVAGPKDQREYLKGVWIDATGARTVLMATNGSQLGALCTDDRQPCADTMFLPLAVVKALPKAKGAQAVARRVGKDVTITTGGSSQFWTDAGHTLLNWRQAVPAAVEDQGARQFDAELIGAFQRVRDDLGLHKLAGGVQIAHGGDPFPKKAPTDMRETASLVFFPDEPRFVGVLMALNKVAVQTQAPMWATNRT